MCIVREGSRALDTFKVFMATGSMNATLKVRELTRWPTPPHLLTTSMPMVPHPVGVVITIVTL
ncbi:hypothetical protein LMG28140_04458 [Paraburkholderia metrosideri]|uniref:Uncharacterized protein n=1 Tax=Paraburkholderia metrosideri TaxID=580937 RepID=A0ABM8NWW0_9BURK|nr:hypothetical protein LMG28140_04458 [Paraburkholderia metrosideri]